MTFKNILLALIASIAFYTATPTWALENDMACQALQMVSNHKGKLALAGTLFASYQLYKKYQKELKPILAKIKLNKDNVFWASVITPSILSAFIFYGYMAYKINKFFNGGITDKIVGNLLSYPIHVTMFAESMAIGMTPYNFLELLKEKYFKAIENNDYKRVKFYSYILGTNINLFNDLPINIAKNSNKIESLKALLNRYDCVANESTKDLVIKDSLEKLETLIKNGTPFDPNMKIQEIPVIICAAINNKPAIVKFLLYRCANIEVTDNKGKTIKDYIEEKPSIKHADNIKAIFEKYRLKVADKVQEQPELIPDIANIVSEYVV